MYIYYILYCIVNKLLLLFDYTLEDCFYYYLSV